MLSAVEHRACLGQPYRFTCEQRALGDQFPMVVIQIIQNRLPADAFRQLRRQELGQRLDLQESAAALIELYPALLPDPALGVVTVCPELREVEEKSVSLTVPSKAASLITSLKGLV